jgi:TfoX N-terminal domain
MARDPGLEELMNDDLGELTGLSSKPMFGGWAWLLNGNFLCGARDDGMLARIGRENEAWALRVRGVVRMISRGKQMGGWVRANPDAYGNDATRRKLLDAALAFNTTLSKK